MKKMILCTIFSLLALALHGQNSCLAIYEDGLNLVEKESEKALEKLQLLEICDRKNNFFIEQREDLRNQIFKAIKKQRNDALKAQNDAENAKRKALAAQDSAIHERNKASLAKDEAIKAKAKADSLKVNEYNKSIAYGKIQEDPTLAWNIAAKIDPSLTTVQDVIYAISNEDKNGFYKKTFPFDTSVLAIGWQKHKDKKKDILLTATADGLLRYWNTEGVLQDSLFFGKNEENKAIISKQGDYALFSRTDSTFTLWDLTTRQLLATRKMTASAIDVAVSNAHTFWALIFQNYFEVYDTKANLVAQIPLNAEPNSIAIADDGIAVVGFDNQFAQFFDVKKKVETYTNKPNLSNLTITKACFDENMDVVFMGLRDFTARLSDLNTAKSNQIFGHINGLTSVAIAQNPHYLATGSQDKTVRLWQNYSDHYQEFAILQGHNSPITQVVFSENAQYIASATENEVKIWLTDGKAMAKFEPSEAIASSFFSLTYLPKSKDCPNCVDSVLAGDGLGRIYLIDSEGKMLRKWQHANVKITALTVFSEFEKGKKKPEIKFFSGSENGSVCIWNVEKKHPDTLLFEKTETADAASVVSIVAHARDKKFFVGFSDGSIKHIKNDGNVIHTFNLFSRITKMRMFNDNLLVAYADGTLELINSKDYTIIKTFIFDESKKASIHALAVSNDGRYIVASSEHDVKIWDWQDMNHPKLTSEPIREAHDNQVADLQFSTDNKHFFSVGWDKIAYMWTLDTRKAYKVSQFSKGSMASLDVAADGKSFVTGASVVSFWHTPQSLNASVIENIKDAHKHVIMPIEFYKNCKDFDVLRDAADKCARLKSAEKADVLYKMASKILADSLEICQLVSKNLVDSVKKEKNDALIELLNKFRREMNIGRCAVLNEKYEVKNAFDKLIDDCQAAVDIIYYADHFFEYGMWLNVKHACLKYQKLAKKTDVYMENMFYVALVELNDDKKDDAVNRLNKAEEKASIRIFFKDLIAKRSDVEIRQKVEYAKIAYKMSKDIYAAKCDNGQYTDVNLDNLASDNINYHWYLIQKGDMSMAKTVIEEGFKFLASKETSSLFNLATFYKLMRMNYAHTLLFTGKIKEATTMINSMVDSAFVDPRFPTFREAFLDDFEAIEKYDSISKRATSKKAVIPEEYRAAYHEIKRRLMREPLKALENNAIPTLPSDNKGEVVASKSLVKKYYVIVGSFKTEKKAQKEAARLNKMATLNLQIINQEEQFRISAFNTAEEKEAIDYKKIVDKQLKVTSWVLEKK